MAKKTVRYNKTGIGRLPNDKPVVYHIKTPGGKSNYVGIAKRGRVQDRLTEHLDGKDRVPGATVQIEQMSRVGEARAKETRVLSRSKPKYNKKST